MSDDGTRITIRMGLEEIQMMEDFMSDHEIENRSDFVRDAVRAYIDLVRSGRPVQQESGIFVRFSELQLSALSGLVSLGVSLDEEEFVRKCVLDKILPKAVEEEAYENAFRAAQRNAALKRRKKDGIIGDFPVGWERRKPRPGGAPLGNRLKKDLWGCKRWHTTTDRRMRTSRRSRS